MKRGIFLIAAFAMIFATSCELIESTDFTPDQPDMEGNLLIINNSNEQLVLYKDQVMIKKIPASATDYLVSIPNDGGSVQLDLYLWEDVMADPYNPIPSEAFKRWMVPLSSDNKLENRATWHISGATTYTNVATLNLSYFGGTENNVDIYLDGRTGAKIASLKPGDQYKKVGVDYGNYTLHYLYWFSDQNDANAFEEKGWIETQMVNEEEKDIWLILNENRKDVTMVVPHLDALLNSGTKYAGIEITNLSGDPVQIYAGDKLIEAVCFLEKGNTQNLSTLANEGVYTFYLPIHEEDLVEKEFIFSAKHLTNGTTVEGPVTVTLIADDIVRWKVDGEPDGGTE
jgi:hypothetical protein